MLFSYENYWNVSENITVTYAHYEKTFKMAACQLFCKKGKKFDLVLCYISLNCTHYKSY